MMTHFCGCYFRMPATPELLFYFSILYARIWILSAETSVTLLYSRFPDMADFPSL